MPDHSDREVLREEVASAITRGADTPDFFSTRPTKELQKILRETPTLAVDSLLNGGGVRFDFERRRVFRDSFWKGSFARDTLLGWEERVRTALLGRGALRAGGAFAGGSFWKRFDTIENGVARGTVVNYEVATLPGFPEVREVEYPNGRRRYFKKGDRILLLNYVNEPYRIVYDTIKVIDAENAIGVMHLGQFPHGIEFSTFVMARNNYPFEKMALEDYQALFAHERAKKPTAAALAGRWRGHLVFLDRPDLSLLNAANPAVVDVSFRRAQGGWEAACRLGPGGEEPGPEFTVHRSLAAMQKDLRMIDEDTMLGRWPMADATPELARALRSFVDTAGERAVFYWVLTRQ